MDNNIKKKCCICGSNNVEDGAPIFFMDEDGNFNELCDRCAEYVAVIDEAENEKDMKTAINYLCSSMGKISDKKVAEYVADILTDNKEYLNESNKQAVENTGTYFTKNSIHNVVVADSSIWVKGIRIFAWIMFISIVLAGIVLGISMGEENGGLGFLLFLASVLIAFLSTAGTMIFLDIAEDTRAIRNMFYEKR